MKQGKNTDLRQDLAGNATFGVELTDAEGTGRRHSSGTVGHRRTARAGRSSKVMLGIVAGAVLLGTVAGFAARGFVSPAQEAALARAPRASLILASVKYGVLSATVVVRADVKAVNPVNAAIPSDLNAALPEVTGVNARVGSQVSNGELLGSVAERPVFAMTGQARAFRDMTPGSQGIDVAQLQAALAAAGYSDGEDQPGDFGPGTQAAVRALYQANGMRPAWTSPNAEQQFTQLTSALESANAAVAKAQAKVNADAGASSATRTADQSALSSAQSHASSAATALSNWQQSNGIEVPRGEVVFVPKLPQRLVSVAGPVGALLKPDASVAVIGSGKVRLRASLDSGQASALRPGMSARALSDTTGKRVRVKISSVKLGANPSTGVPTATVIFAPRGQLPAGWVGQNVGVTIMTASSKTRTLIVPLAAISTSVSGSAYVTVSGGGRTRQVPVTLGISAGGQQSVTPVRPNALREGDHVVLGATSQ